MRFSWSVLGTDQNRKLNLMKRCFRSLRSVIGASSGITAIYLLSIILRMSIECILFLYGISLVALCWMTIRILKDPYENGKTFDEFFYLDREDLKPTPSWEKQGRARL